MKKYHLTKKAFEDLSDIWTYTYDNWSEEQADKYYSILISTIEDIVADRLYACRPYPQIGKDIWGYSPDDDIETIRVHIRHLRSKIDKISGGKKYIETIYGGGYKLNI